jgi:uncharacterized protein
MKERVELITSRYNFAIPVAGARLLYNSRSGVVLRLKGKDTRDLCRLLTDHPHRVDLSGVSKSLFRQLLEGAFVLPQGTDEVAAVRELYWTARREAPMTLTITTTMDCNLGCYYCYEERSGEALTSTDVSAIVALAEARLVAHQRRSLHIDWYGGEPLLNLPVFEAASTALQELCARRRVSYSASIVSNGTAWPDDIPAFVARHRIRQVQISFDGLPANHNKRRHYRRGRAPGSGATSFELAASVVDQLVDLVRVDIRLNIDAQNREDLPGFVRFMSDRGWFSGRVPAVFQPARVSAFSERSAFIRKSQLGGAEFDAMRRAAREQIAGCGAAGRIAVEESEAPDGYPYPRNSVCGALAEDSFVVGAEGGLYRCGLQVSEPHRAIGTLRSEATSNTESRRGKFLPMVAAPDAGSGDHFWWSEFDPTRLPTCARCSFLPVCWAGCPKVHLEGDAYAIAEQGSYWRRNLCRLVAEGAKERLIGDGALNEADQFR